MSILKIVLCIENCLAALLISMMPKIFPSMSLNRAVQPIPGTSIFGVSSVPPFFVIFVEYLSTDGIVIQAELPSP